MLMQFSQQIRSHHLRVNNPSEVKWYSKNYSLEAAILRRKSHRIQGNQLLHNEGLDSVDGLERGRSMLDHDSIP